jgi:hypothetical protein
MIADPGLVPDIFMGRLYFAIGLWTKLASWIEAAAVDGPRKLFMLSQFRCWRINGSIARLGRRASL